MELKIKTFEELTLEELYEILRLRSQVFVVEQGGRYQDLDQIDYESTHIFCVNENHEMEGCLRIFPKKDEAGTVQIGRLAALNRNQGMGSALMDQAVIFAKEKYQAKELFLTGRKDAFGFYIKCGFYPDSKELGNVKSPYFEFRRSLL